jgi:hypothetical protein
LLGSSKGAFQKNDTYQKRRSDTRILSQIGLPLSDSFMNGILGLVYKKENKGGKRD